MRALLALSRAIDALSEGVGRIIVWLVLAVSLLSAGNALMRYAFRYSSNAYLEGPVVPLQPHLPPGRRLRPQAQRPRAH